MTIATMTLLLFLTAIAAGCLGAMTGLGGGVVIVPVLWLVFKVDMPYAIGASLVSVIATSCGSSAAYVKEGYTNIRVGLFLEIATTMGALVGAAVAAFVAPGVVAVIFGVVLLSSAYLNLRPRPEHVELEHPDRIASWLRLDSSYPAGGPDSPMQRYCVKHVPAGFWLMGLAGVLSGLLGIGSGALKVLAMDQAMRLPFKVSTTTSNFMIGVTAAASAGVYLHRGQIDPGLTMPIVLGVLAGSAIGAKVLVRAPVRLLRWVFSAVIVVLACEMIYNGLAAGRG